jgi:site-specific DNA-methyltransferase (adenine-specific)
MSYAIEVGSVAEVLADYNDNSFDGLLCDPPYGLSFMGKRWDYDVPSVEDWAACLRVLKPGAPLLAFGGSRTFHRIVCGIEDAGFEIRDSLMWIFGSGFPKSLNVGKALDKAAGAERPVVGSRTLTGNAAVSTKDKGGTYGVMVGTAPSKVVDVTGPATELAQQWDGYGTALKPAHEPICLARKPLDGTVAENVTRWGVGALAIDRCRIGYASEADRQATIVPQPNTKNKRPGVHDGADCSRNGDMFDPGHGRWPANLLFDEDAAEVLNAQTGTIVSRPSVTRNGGGGGMLPNAKLPGKARPDSGYSDSGGASRFFYTTKVGRKERERGCEALALKSAGGMTEREDESAGLDSPRAGAGRTGGARNHHPTLKPISLTEYLARLILPPTPDAVLLVPYSGAGSEVIGALMAGWPNVFGIEREAEYATIAHARLAHWIKEAA